MTALNDLVRKIKNAVTGSDEAPARAKPFDWEPAAAIPAPAPTLREAGPRELAPLPSGTPGSWKRGGSELPSLVGGSIPADVADFATVYKGAAVQAPGHEYGVDRVGTMLEHKSLAGLDKGVKASAVLAALDAAGVSIKDVIHDGLLRYKALVAFEAAKELELHQVRPRNERRVEELQAASEGFQKRKQAEIDALTRESAGAMASLTRLKTRQRAEEERFHRTVSLFVEPLPARVIAMTPKPAESVPAPGAETKPELKLVSPIPPAQPKPLGDPTVAIRTEPAKVASGEPKAEPPAGEPATKPGEAPAKEEVKS
jgi:hypothetical protein